MASILKKGSSGAEVKQLQTLLNQKGYNLSVDGVFGAKTLAAVQDYQRNSSLSVDGIVGANTWSALNGSSAQTLSTTPLGTQYDPATTTANAADLSSIEGTRPTYTESDALKTAAEQIASWEQNKPASYQSTYDQQIKALADQILNRQAFSYNFNADPMYQQYKNQYTQLGNTAMLDTMGNAAALTGGYGSSYATTAGNQAYQSYLTQLNNVIPELYDAAYDRYANEGTQMTNNLSMLQGLDQSDYSKYRDTVSDYYNDLNYYYTKYNDMSETEYNKYLNNISQWQTDRDYYYGKTQDDQTQANWQAEYDATYSKKKK